MTDHVPVVILAFANATKEHLDLLKAESNEIRQTLAPLERSGAIKIQYEESCQLEELFNVLTATDAAVIVHYGGHANGQLLQFEDGAGGREGLARLLGRQRGLKVVFLNGCASQGHAPALLNAGVAAVIATSVPIGDNKAREFAAAFYAALANGQSAGDAFESSRGLIEAKYSANGKPIVPFVRQTRQIGTDDEADAASTDPVSEWGLFIRDDCSADLAQWRLANARAAWSIQLTDMNGPVRALDGSPLALDYLLPARTLPAVTCRGCATAVLTGPALSSCPVCGSTELAREPVRTDVAAERLPFVVTEDAARERARAAIAGIGDASATAIYIPFFVFDAESRTTIDAERGWNRFSNGAISTQWEPVKDAVDLSRSSYVVPATTRLPSITEGHGDWYWRLGEAEAVKALDGTAAYLPLDRSLQSTFDELASNLSAAVDDEIENRVGGHERRNVQRDTRYKSLSVRSVLLPHWLVAATLNGATTRLLVNGQTGAVRRLLTPGMTRALTGGDSSMTDERTFEPATALRSDPLWISGFAGAGIGLMVGALLGLAAPAGNGQSIAGIFIAAVGAALAAVLGLNDSHFSMAKGLRIGAFGLSVLLSAPTSVFVRTHNYLGADPPQPLAPAVPAVGNRNAPKPPGATPNPAATPSPAASPASALKDSKGQESDAAVRNAAVDSAVREAVQQFALQLSRLRLPPVSPSAISAGLSASGAHAAAPASQFAQRGSAGQINSALDADDAIAVPQSESRSSRSGTLFGNEGKLDYAATLDPKQYGGDPVTTLEVYRTLGNNEFATLANVIRDLKVSDSDKRFLLQVLPRAFCRIQYPDQKCD